MNTKAYTRLLANPSRLQDQDLNALDAIVERYPFFQSARALQLKALKSSNSYRYNDALRQTAAHTTDRDILFEYITSEDFSQNEISEKIQQNSEAVKAMEVVGEDLSAQVSLELEAQLRGEIKKAEAILDPQLFERKVESLEILADPDPEPAAETPAEETLKLDQPLEFSKSDTHSFGEWLKLTQATPIDRSEETKEPVEISTPVEAEKPKSAIERKFDLIDKFIQSKPKLDPTADGGKNKNLAKPFIQRPDSMMTETLAKVYVQQKNYKKAIQAYQILILKNPEKSGFFADQIRAIKQLIKKE